MQIVVLLFLYLIKFEIIDIVFQILDIILRDVLGFTSFDELDKVRYNVVDDEPQVADELTSVETVQTGLIEHKTTKSFFEQSVDEFNETQEICLKIGLLRHVQLIGQHFSRLFPNTRLYFLLHNIDAPHLRSYDTQLVLAHLAELPQVHFLTSIDDPNANISLYCTL